MDINYFHLVFWFIIFLILVIIEVLTTNLVTSWFAIGSIFSFFSSFFTKNFSDQVFVFLIFSFIGAIFINRYLIKVSKFKKIATNSDSLIGKSCLVTKEINNFLNEGEVRVDKNIWSALCNDENVIIKEGAKVKILGIRGVKVIVEEIN